MRIALKSIYINLNNWYLYSRKVQFVPNMFLILWDEFENNPEKLVEVHLAVYPNDSKNI